MFGWNIWVRKRTLGGFDGNSSVNSIINYNTAPSQSVSSGPKMMASQIIILSALGFKSMPKSAASC